MEAQKIMWLKTTIFIFITLLILIPALLVYGSYRWNARTQTLLAKLDAARVTTTTTTTTPTRIDFRELDNLPAPVQRFFRAALKDGAPMISSLTVKHTGTFNMGQTNDQWKPFTSTQHVVIKPPGFVWDGRVAMLPGLDVHVHDAYIAGEGILNPAIAGLFSLTDLRGTGDIAVGELMRYFAEAAMYPTALLPSQGVAWEAVDDCSAKATMQDHGMSITLTFRFNNDNLIEGMRAESRGRTVGNVVVPTPWEGHFFNYESRGGVKVPMEGEVGWVLPEGKKPYWRGRIVDIAFEFAQ
jgi:hypothetical protein